MQLDRTRITIRERTTFELFDLALRVVRSFAGPLFRWVLVGVLPFALLNHWVLAGNPFIYEPEQLGATYTWWLLCLVVLEMPLATAPATLYLGQVLFHQTPTRSRIFGDLARSLPQLLVLQGWPLAGLLFCFWIDEASITGMYVVLAMVPFCFFRFGFRPYMNEIILLERNPLSTSNATRISTPRRSKALHSWSQGELFERFLASLLFGSGLALQLCAVAWGAKSWLTGNAELSPNVFAILLQASLWAVVGFFAVVRFLCYLDLRIRREGWEVDLRMRAEAARLSKELI
ncbi:MAG: hypothetical protein DWQ31_09625 [Planctomycetota bacterium]|nr:MAG: hypothetical protein DWQ31_09625 [Planctomycetota bacterium]REK29152.1 MAG: hypothetical protein DWQ42_04080 [Planctomycetota bacterium]REK39945.1 MAG: hypothetical protein DWQ46_17345 [Planctomycetota bacterium]